MYGVIGSYAKEQAQRAARRRLWRNIGIVIVGCVVCGAMGAAYALGF
jgi:hypothetical protein